jgi:WD40 repeat protein
MSDLIHTLALIDLPSNLLIVISNFLNLREICKIGEVCRRFREISENYNLWAHVLPGVPIESKKFTFLKRSKITLNIRKKAALPYLLQAHSDMVLSLDVKGDQIVSASRDGTVCHWNVTTKRGIAYKGHSDWVTSAKFFEDGIVSASADRSVRVWTTEAPEGRILRGHSMGVTCLKLATPVVAVTGAHDCTVKVWDLAQARLITSFGDHSSAISSLDICEPMMATGAVQDGKVLVRDLTTGTIIQTLQL